MKVLPGAIGWGALVKVVSDNAVGTINLTTGATLLYQLNLGTVVVGDILILQDVWAMAMQGTPLYYGFDWRAAPLGVARVEWTLSEKSMQMTWIQAAMEILSNQNLAMATITTAGHLDLHGTISVIGAAATAYWNTRGIVLRGA